MVMFRADRHSGFPNGLNIDSYPLPGRRVNGGIKRFEMSEAQWQRIAALLPGEVADPGRAGADNRLSLNGSVWMLRSGARWCDLPERYGKWNTVHRRFGRWCHAGFGDGCSWR